MEGKFIITEHARKRFFERFKTDEEIEQIIKKVFKNGKNLNKKLLKTTVLLGYHLENYWTATYKVYEKMIFVFQKNYLFNGNVNFVLTTIIPLKFLIQRRNKMLKNYQKKLKKLYGKNINRKSPGNRG